MRQVFINTKFDFISGRFKALAVSASIITLGLIVLIVRGPNWSIDFRGGLDIQVRFEKTVTDGEVRSALSDMDVGEVKTISSLGQRDEIAIRLKESTDSEETLNLVREHLDAAFPDNVYDFRNVQVVGPKVGRELRRQAILSAVVALVLLLVYISWRFEFKFAVGGIAALFHDVLMTLAFFAFFNYELSLSVLAAFLTLIGFSLNDTIVVYDRVRENLRKLRQSNLRTIMNQSINETLSRTVITSITVFLSVLVLFIFGGPVLRGFSFAMMVGIITGTYSSVFIAAPVVLEWAERTAIKGKRR